MYDESINILEDIRFEENRWHPLFAEARNQIYRDAREWEHVMTTAKLKQKSKPNSIEWLLNYADGRRQMGDTENAKNLVK